MKCDVCEGDFDKHSMTSTNPQRELGDNFPDSASFCPECFSKFLRKVTDVLGGSETVKMDNLKKIVRD